MKLDWLSLLLWEQLLSQIHVLLSTITPYVECIYLIILVLLSFSILCPQQQKGHERLHLLRSNFLILPYLYFKLRISSIVVGLKYMEIEGQIFLQCHSSVSKCVYAFLCLR